MTEHAISMAERKDLLVLAQQKLDEMNRGNSFVVGTKSPSSKKGTATASLLSTLLYMALLSYKVEDMKAMLKHVDMESYEEWDALLAVLHSPEFHVKERTLQNERVVRTFERKNQYKMKAEQLATSRTAIKCKLDEVQRISNETSNEMSKTINMLQQEMSELNKKLHDSYTTIERERKLVQSLKDEAMSKDIAIENLNQQLKSANEDGLELKEKLHDSYTTIEMERKSVQSLKDEATSKDIAIENLNQQLKSANEDGLELKEKLHDSYTTIEMERKSVQALKIEAMSKDIAIENLNQQLKSANEDGLELKEKLHDSYTTIEMERKSVQSLKDEAMSKDIAIENLNQQLKSANEDALVAATELCESKSRVESIESQFTSYKKEKELQIIQLQQELIKAESRNASLSEQLTSFSQNLESKVASLCKSTAELLDESKKASDAQMEDRSVLSGMNVRSQEIHEVLLQVRKEQKQVDVYDIYETIRSTMCEELQELRRTLDNQITPTKPRSCGSDTEIEPENSTDAFVQHVLSEAFATTICT